MVMAEYFIHDRLQELWQQINDLHLSYLDTEDSPQKIEQRNKLEGCIREYLCLSPHNRKFFCSETAEVLHRSASNKKDFSGYKAAVGWNAISIYAGNLLSQPWRKEYRQIKTYSGFYKHQIEANLAGAEAVFEAMGYKYMGSGVLALEGPVCPDRLTHVSQDSIVAFVECQILKTIWEEVSNVFKISWLDVLEFRESHICSPEQSIRMLNYRYHEKRYQEQHQQQNRSYSQGTDTYTTVPRYAVTANNHPIQSHVINHAPPITNMHSFPPPTSHAHMGVPNIQHAHLPNYLPISSHCQAQCIYGNPYYNYPTYAPITPHFPRFGGIPYPVCPPKGCNGYCYPNGCVQTSAYVCPVPTGQLIELEGQNGSYDTPDGVIKNMRQQQDYLESHKQLAKSTNLDSWTLSKSREDGAGTFESWDYVYKNLESQGYNKDLGERGDLLQERRKNVRDRRTKPSIELEDAFNTLNLNLGNSHENNVKVSEGVKRFSTVTEVNNKQESKIPLSNSYDNITQEACVTNGVTKTRMLSRDKVLISPEKPSHTIDTKKLRNKDVDKIKGKDVKKKNGSWNCQSCTFLNSPSDVICTMCGRSKKVVDISMQVGGQECPACTLVNPKDIDKCQACNTSLKGSPTYI